MKNAFGWRKQGRSFNGLFASMFRTRNRLRDEGGITMVAVLIAVTLTMALSAFGSRGARTEMMIARNDLYAQRALGFADAGVAEALALLETGWGSGFDSELSNGGTGGALAALGEPAMIDGEAWRFRQFGTRSDDGYYVRLVDNYDDIPDAPGVDTDNRVAIQSIGRVSGAERMVETQVRPIPLYAYALFADEWLRLDSNVYSDSFDSDLGSYCGFAKPISKSVNCSAGANSCAARMTDGSLGTNGTQDSVIIVDTNTYVYGGAQTGPGSTTGALENNGTIANPVDVLEEPKDLPPTDAPTPGPGAVAEGNWNITCNNCSETRILAPGDHVFGSIKLRGNNMTLTIKVSGDTNLFMSLLQAGGAADLIIDTGASDSHVQIVTDDLLLLSNGEFNFIGTGDSKVTLYANNSVDMDSQFGMNNSWQDATRMSIIGTSTLTGSNLNFASNTVYFGTIYAPLADITIKSNVEIYGAVIANTIDFMTRSCIHYDEALGRPAEKCCRLGYWKEVRDISG